LIEPRRGNSFESRQTFNTAAVDIGGRVHFVYRAIGDDLVSRFGYANSVDGVSLDERVDRPIYQYNPQHPSYYSYLSGGSMGGVEDPRVVRIDDSVYVTYTVADGSGLSVAITSLSVEDFLNKNWDSATVRALSPREEIHKNWVLFPEKVHGKYALLHSITPKILVDYFEDLVFEGANFIRSYHNGVPSGSWTGGWEGRVRGIGPPPIRTDSGWLAFYHGLPRNNLDSYCIGAMLLDLDDPTKILYRARDPVITPWDIENVVKQNIVYACGALIRRGKLFVYYGAGDTKVHFAYTDSAEFLESLREQRLDGGEQIQAARPSVPEKPARRRRRKQSKTKAQDRRGRRTRKTKDAH
jgi:predicted GH43/DUF377 family glycosyl hydrolase